jgi:hypothetical protein
MAIGAVLAVVAWVGSAGAQVAPPAPEAIAVGDWTLAPLIELRVRGEYRRDVDEADHGLLVERSRLGVEARRGPLAARVVLQDARALDLGGSANAVPGPQPIAVTGAFEAWAEAHTWGVRPSFVRVGRQPIAWGEGRLLGIADWSPTGRALDAARGRVVVGDGAFELLASVLTEPETSVSLQAYGELLGARAEWAFDPLFAIDAYALARIAYANPLVSLNGSVRGQTYTEALRLHGDGRGWTWGLEGAVQLGWADDLAVARAAWAAVGHVSYTFDGAVLTPNVRVGASYASGDPGGSANRAKDRAFDPLLPDVHVWNGAMDLFAWSNEEEVNARGAIVPFTDLVAAVDYRYVRLAQPGDFWRTAYLTSIGRASDSEASSLGHEVDASLKWSPSEPVILQAGYSALLLGDGARAILAANGIGRFSSSGGLSIASLSHFAYAQATLTLP